MKDYLGFENERNKKHAALYTKLIKRAYGEGASEVLIGHHLTFESHGDLNTENEIPSADTLLFDHEIMRRVFGEKALWVMMGLAQQPAEERDAALAIFLEQIEVAEAVAT